MAKRTMYTAMICLYLKIWPKERKAKYIKKPKAIIQLKLLKGCCSFMVNEATKGPDSNQTKARVLKLLFFNFIKATIPMIINGKSIKWSSPTPILCGEVRDRPLPNIYLGSK